MDQFSAEQFERRRGSPELSLGRFLDVKHLKMTDFDWFKRLGKRLAHDDPIVMWIPTCSGDTIARLRRGPEGKTLWVREYGRKWA